jgi:hypothetical protein
VRTPYRCLTSSPSAQGEEEDSGVIGTTHLPLVLQIRDHASEAASADDDTLSDDEFFDCPEDGPATIGPSVNQPTDPPAPSAEIDSGEVAGPESRSLTPKPVEPLSRTRGIYRLLNLVTERGTGGISE